MGKEVIVVKLEYYKDGRSYQPDYSCLFEKQRHKHTTDKAFIKRIQSEIRKSLTLAFLDNPFDTF